MAGTEGERSTRTSTTPGRKLMRPFSCKHCVSFFSDLDSYRRHTTRHKKKYRVSSTPRSAHQPNIRPLSWVVDLEKYKFNISVVGVIPKAIHQAEVTKQDQKAGRKRGSAEQQNDRVKRQKRLKPSRTKPTYECKHCGRTFKKRQQLWGHIRVHSEMGYKEEKSKLLECKHCKKLFAYKCDLSKHESKHEAEGRFQCPYCNSRFKSQGELNKHISSNKQRGEYYQCSKCDIYSESKCQRELHIEQKHKKMLKVVSSPIKAKPKQEKLICPLCLKQFVQLPTLLSHITEHHSEKHQQQDHTRLLCKFCDITFKKREYLRKHMKRAHPEFDEAEKQINSLPSSGITGNRLKKKKPVRCPLCHMLFPTVNYLALHLQHSHVADTNDTDDSLLKCKDCHKLFKKRKYLAEHMKRMHKPLPTGRSPKKFLNEDDGEQSHKCLICPAVYTTYVGMMNHIRRKHRASGLASAIQLGGGVDIKKDNAIPGHHNTTVDESKNKFQCLRCLEAFSSEEDLVKHIPVHRKSSHNHKELQDSVTVKEEGVSKACQSPCFKPGFKCGYCLQAFDNRRVLNRHMVQNHADDEIVI